MSDIPNLSGKVGLDVTDFKAGIAQLNREIRVVESGFRATAAGLGDWAKSASGLETRIKALNGEIDLQKKKVAALETEYQRIVKEKGETSRAAQDLQIKLNKETETLNKMQVELKDTDKALEDMTKEEKDAAKGAGALADKEDQAKTATGRLHDALDKLKSKLSGLGNDFKNLGDKVLKGLAVGIAGIATAAAGAVVGLGALILKTTEAADNIQESAEKLGITAEQYQEFGFVADQIGTDVDTIAKAFARTTKAMGEAEKGTSPAAEAFKTLGIKVKDTSGNFRDTQAVFSDVIDALGNVQDETQREILAQQLFGKSYQELIPLINLGADGLAEMTQKARDMGVIIPEDEINKAAELNDKIAALKKGFGAIVTRLASAFMPLVTKIVDKLTKMLSDPKIQAGIQNLVDKIGEFATVIGNVLDKLLAGDLKGAFSEIFPADTVDKIMAFGKAIKDVIFNTIIPFVTKHAKAIKAAIIGIGAVLAAAGIVSLIASIANPLGLIIAAVGLLAAAWAEDWGGIRTTITAWWNEVGKPIFDQLVAWLKVTIPAAIKILSEFWTNVLQPALQTFWGWVQTTVFPIVQTLWNWLATNIPVAIQTLSDFWTNTLQPAISTFWTWVQTTIFPIIQTLWDWLATNVPAAIQTLSDFWTLTLQPALQTIWDFITTNILPIFQDIIDIATKLGEITLTALAGFWEKTLQPALEKVWGYFNDHIMPIFTTVRDFIRDEIGPKIQWLTDSVFTPLGETLMGGVKTALDWLHEKLLAIKDFLDNFTLPPWLTPGSPTPFELGLRGIADAMDELNNKTASVNFAPRQLQPAMASGKAPIQIIIQGAPQNEMNMRRQARYVAEEIQRRQS
jgi:hypothetical protein